MLYIENNCNDPSYNLAFEEFLFRSEDIDEPVLLLWQNGPSVIIGKYQNALEEVDLDYLGDRSIALVRRSTGGGAVYHDLGNLNFSFIVPRSVPGADTAGGFEAFSRPVLDALSSMGIEAECSGRNDMLAGGYKFSGCAQQRSASRILHHGTLMFDLDIEAAGRALRPKPGKFRSKSVKSVRSRITNLKPMLIAAGHPDDMTVLDFRDRILDHFRSIYPVRSSDLSEKQLDEIGKLRSEKYATDRWNLGRSPRSDMTCGDFFACGQIEFHFSLKGNLISGAQITGDFFSNMPQAPDGPDGIAELEHALTGLTYERSAILDCLKQADLASLFGDVTAEELADTIF